MWAVPLELEDALYAATRAAIGDAALATPALARAIVDRSARYTSDRARLARPADRTGDLAARAVFFSVTDALKIAIPLAELANRDALPVARPVRIVDLGAGCGAMTLGALTVLDDIEVTAIDRDPDALAIARTAIADFAARRGARARIATTVDDVTRAAIPPCDLVVMGTVLNELDEDRACALVDRALAAIGDDGAVIVVEPALRDTSRALHRVRDTILARGGHVFAPCTRRAAPCPALADPDDWCHEDRPLALPPRTAELARLTHLRDSGMKLSYLTLRRRPRALVDDPDAWRIVSAARVAKGKHEVFGCSDRGRMPLRLLKRHRTPDNRELERVERGDVVVTSDAPDDERVEIRGPVVRHQPAKR